jgi:hypothetical protein
VKLEIQLRQRQAGFFCGLGALDQVVKFAAGPVRGRLDKYLAVLADRGECAVLDFFGDVGPSTAIFPYSETSSICGVSPR